MPLFVLLAVALLTPLVILVLMPLGLIQRFRTGTARRMARQWLATFNATLLTMSGVLFLGGAAITGLWVPHAFSYSLGGFAAGCLLGILGLVFTRWESTSGRLHYTPNRTLVLIITLLVSGRLAYGLWRLWQTWQTGTEGQGWLIESGVAGSLAVGAVVLGYSLSYWIGVRRQTMRMQTRPPKE